MDDFRVHCVMSRMHIVSWNDTTGTHAGERRRRLEADLKGTAKAEAAHRRAKEYSDRASERQVRRTRPTPWREKLNTRHIGKRRSGPMKECRRGVSGGSSRSAVGTSKSRNVGKRNEPDEARHPEDRERADGKKVRAEWPKRNAEDKDEENRLKKALTYSKRDWREQCRTV